MYSIASHPKRRTGTFADVTSGGAKNIILPSFHVAMRWDWCLTEPQYIAQHKQTQRLFPFENTVSLLSSNIIFRELGLKVSICIRLPSNILWTGAISWMIQNICKMYRKYLPDVVGDWHNLHLENRVICILSTTEYLYNGGITWLFQWSPACRFWHQIHEWNFVPALIRVYISQQSTFTMP